MLDGGGFDDPAERVLARGRGARGRPRPRGHRRRGRLPRARGLRTSRSTTRRSRPPCQGALDALPAADVVVGDVLLVDRRRAGVRLARTGTRPTSPSSWQAPTRRRARRRTSASPTTWSCPSLTTLRGGQVPVFVDVNTQVSEDIAKAESLSIPLLVDPAHPRLRFARGRVAAARRRPGRDPRRVHGPARPVAVRRRLDLLRQHRDDARSRAGHRLLALRRLALPGGAARRGVGRGRRGPHRRHRRAHRRLLRAHRRGGALRRSCSSRRTSCAPWAPAASRRSSSPWSPRSRCCPALLGVLGPKVDALTRPAARGRGAGSPGRPTRTPAPWARLARGVMRRPVPVAVAVVAVLVVLGAPFLRVAFGGVDSRVLPTGTESRVAAEALQQDFPGSSAASPMDVVVRARRRPGRGRRVRLRARSRPRRHVGGRSSAPRAARRTWSSPTPGSRRTTASLDPGRRRPRRPRTGRLRGPRRRGLRRAGRPARRARATGCPWVGLFLVADDVRPAVPGLRVGRAARSRR